MLFLKRETIPTQFDGSGWRLALRLLDEHAEGIELVLWYSADSYRTGHPESGFVGRGIKNLDMSGFQEIDQGGIPDRLRPVMTAGSGFKRLEALVDLGRSVGKVEVEQQFLFWCVRQS